MNHVYSLNEMLKNKPCPCGSGKLSQNCCLMDDLLWYKHPCHIIPKKPSTGVANDKCYAALYQDCSREITHEHYVSQSVLQQIDSTVEIHGLSWQKGKKQRVPVSKLVSKVLCKRHNETFSCLDSQAARFFQTIRAIASFTTPDRFFLFNGKDIERWMLKTLYGLLASKSLQVNTGQRIITPIDMKCLDLLFDERPWDNHRGLFIRTERDHTIVHSNSLHVFPVLNTHSSKVYGMQFTLRGFDFLLATTNIPIDEGTSLYRPKQIILDKNGEQKIIEFTWDDPSHNQIVIFKWTGKAKRHKT